MEPIRRPPESFFSDYYVLAGGDPVGIAPEIIPAAIQTWIRERKPDEKLIYFANCRSEYLQALSQNLDGINWQSITRSQLLTLLRAYRGQSNPDPKIQSGIDPDKTIKQSADTNTGLLQDELDPQQAMLFLEYQKNELIIVDLFSELNDEQKNQVQMGRPDFSSAKLSFQALELACQWIETFSCRGLLTAPLSKKQVDMAMQADGLEQFLGHTGFLAQRFQSQVLMLMHGKHFSVIPLTVHIPIASVAQRLKQELENQNLVDLLRQLHRYSVFQNQKWAMCALNPHAGDQGLLGTEELDYINDWVAQMQRLALPLEGPYAADGLFQTSQLATFRLILACYHDQGLIPFKSMEGNNGVNCTIGLPFLRTSPDHGTAYEIAGQQRADSGSMERAMQVLISGEFS